MGDTTELDGLVEAVTQPPNLTAMQVAVDKLRHSIRDGAIDDASKNEIAKTLLVTIGELGKPMRLLAIDVMIELGLTRDAIIGALQISLPEHEARELRDRLIDRTPKIAASDGKTFEGKTTNTAYRVTSAVAALATIGGVVTAYFLIAGGLRWAVIGGIAVVGGGVFIYALRALDTRCPSCGASFRRERSSHVVVSTTRSQRQESVDNPVKDAAGNEIGTSSSTRTVWYRRDHYKDVYRCRACQHTWEELWDDDDVPERYS